MRRYQSRLAEVEEQKSIKSAIIFGGLTIIIIILAILFGIPLFSKFVNLFNKPSANPIASSAPTLVPPNLSNLPQYTNQKTITVSGTGPINSTIKVFFNNSSDSTVVDNTGNFSISVGLTKGANTIYAKTVDDRGIESASSTTYTVNFTDQVPNLTITVPQNNQTFYGSGQQSLNVQGSTDTGNSVTINDHIVIVDNAGKFSYQLNLQNGDNNIKIVSKDNAGNKKEVTLKVTFNP